MPVPVVRPHADMQRRAALLDGPVQHLLPGQYRGSPVGDGRSLVTIDRSCAIGPCLAAQSGLPFAPHMTDDVTLGIGDPWQPRQNPGGRGNHDS